MVNFNIWLFNSYEYAHIYVYCECVRIYSVLLICALCYLLLIKMVGGMERNNEILLKIINIIHIRERIVYRRDTHTHTQNWEQFCS